MIASNGYGKLSVEHLCIGCLCVHHYYYYYYLCWTINANIDEEAESIAHTIAESGGDNKLQSNNTIHILTFEGVTTASIFSTTINPNIKFNVLEILTCCAAKASLKILRSTLTNLNRTNFPQLSLKSLQ